MNLFVQDYFFSFLNQTYILTCNVKLSKNFKSKNKKKI